MSTGYREPKKLPLHDIHVALGARMTEFAGWLMPEHYGSITKEHMQVRRRAGLFDVSHMGRLLIRGAQAAEAVGRMVAGDVTRLAPGRARYTFLTAPWGGILDDLIAYRRPDGMLLIVNASRTNEDRAWIEERLLPDTSLDDLTDLTCLFAFQGSEADRALSPLLSFDPAELKSFSFTHEKLAGVEVSVMRTGYTGEPGVEILVASENAAQVWNALLETGRDGAVRPCGLGARDSLRLEAGLLLHGRDMGQDTTPFDVGLGPLVDLDRPDFVGHDALVEAAQTKRKYKLVGLSTRTRPIPRSGDELVADGRPVGVITSGTYSPVLGHPIALGRVETDQADVGTELVFRDRQEDPQKKSREGSVRVVDLPFYRRGVTSIPAEHESSQDAAGSGAGTIPEEGTA